jgi:hypothetical protein
MPDQDPYADIAKPIEGTADPYAAIAKPELTATGIAAPQGTAGTGHTGRDVATGVAQGAANTTGNLVSGTARLLNKIPGVGEYLAPEQGIRSLEARTKQVSTPENTTQKVGKYGEQIGEWMIPSGAEEKAATLVGEHLPQLARFGVPAARALTGAGEAGLRSASQGGEFKTGAEIGAGGSMLGEAGRALAPKAAETALGISNRLRGHGRTIGEAALNETTGIRPETIAQQAATKLRTLTGNLESAAGNATGAGQMGTTAPAHAILDNAIANAPRNAPGYRAKLESLRPLLELNPNAGAQNRVFNPEEVLELKRGIDKEISSWDHAAKLSVDPVKRQLYRALDSELDRTVPEAQALNQRISSLIPVKQRAEQLTRNAGLGQRIAHRIGAHTGALAATGIGAGIGGGLGYHRAGIPGAIVGGGMGLAVPELIASPITQMMAARALRSPIPVALAKGTAAQVPYWLRQDEEEQPAEK